MPVEWRKGGLAVQGTPLWLDARVKAPLGFVSHAHSDHLARHEHVIATPQTLVLMAHRLGPLLATTAVPYRRPLQLADVELELLPAGHVLGSAQVRVTRGDGHRLVYTGDLCLDPGLTATAGEVVTCDTLVIESTFGHPRYRFPPRREAYDAVAAWALSQLERGVRPVLLAYSLGKSQEAIAQLSARGLSLCAHASIHDVAQLYSSMGVEVLARRFDGHFLEHEVGVFPPSASARAALTGPLATAALTGWALERWGARRAGADVAFPVSDHADFPSLLGYAAASGAREIITVHGFAAELAASLRGAGLFARAVTEGVQLELPW
jgi:putative mRNA 3-end processing factor